MIDENAFYNCSKLTNVYYEGTLENWCNIEIVNQDSNPMKYASHFYMLNENEEWYELKELVIPDIIKTINDYQFYGFNSLTSITISNGVINIGKYSFAGCSSITSIVIPDSVISIGEYAFYKCTALESITLPFIGQYADGSGATHFGYIFGASTYSNQNHNVPKSLKEVIITGDKPIGNYAFANCTYLETVIISDSVQVVGELVFYGSSLATIYCEHLSKPNEWDSSWNYYRPVYWAGEWEYDVNGNPIPLV